METLKKPKQIASILNVSRSKVFVMMKCSDCKPVLFERSVLVCPEDQEHFINQNISVSASNSLEAKLAEDTASLESIQVNPLTKGEFTHE